MHFYFFVRKVCCVRRRFCRADLSCIFFWLLCCALLYCAWLAAAECSSWHVCRQADGSTEVINGGNSVMVSAQPVKRIKEGGGSAAAGIKKDRQELMMTVYDENGAKRLLSSRHPACLAEGLYFVFPNEACDGELCINNGVWTKAGRQIYVLPPEDTGEVLRVQFRARTEDGRMYYSRTFVLMSDTGKF